ncbi:RNA-binding cell elongation regulator Jag/EloR [Macrococcus brunensis]|uniref:RNA-binding cell elongation regulator Jag/EloR n=1 Tax=Macrococcus brunensis TaxID=198483 RepID=UPI001EF08D81|nr:RNA-binding cell elongation regulator Jag/EloR [Macrococcus brunensis]ULG74190.1 protein jag [Macrococcus brunensis]
MQETFTGTTVEEAVQNGLSSLNVSEQQVKVEVDDPGKKGLFGIGRRDAVVTLIIIDPELKRYTLTELKDNIQKNAGNEEEPAVVTDELVEEKVIEEPVQQAEERQKAKKDLSASVDGTLQYLIQILKHMGIEATGVVATKSNEVSINLDSVDAARIIGKRGHTLNALQTVAETHLQQTHKGYVTVMLDIENYREKRKGTLENLALNMAQKALTSQEPVQFEPMPNYERKIIHQVLMKMKNIETYSEGREPHRYLVIKSK